MLPVLFQSESLILYSYPLLMGLGWGVAYQIFFGGLSSETPRLRAQGFFWGLFLVAWLGAKTLFLVTIPAGLSSTLMGQGSFWTGGGFVFYGGLLAGLLFVLLFLKIRSLDETSLAAILPALAIGHGIGRIGCFLAGCCFGDETNFFWGIQLHGVTRHPTQLLEAAGLLALGFWLLKNPPSFIFRLSNYLIVYGVFRLLIEVLRGDPIRGDWGPLTPSQWISLACLLMGIILRIRKDSALKNLIPAKFK